MTQNNLMETKMRDSGWLKLLPNENVKTPEPHRFRYISPDYSSGVVIIEEGRTLGVYTSSGASEIWRTRYNEVPWELEHPEEIAALGK